MANAGGHCYRWGALLSLGGGGIFIVAWALLIFGRSGDRDEQRVRKAENGSTISTMSYIYNLTTFSIPYIAPTNHFPSSAFFLYLLSNNFVAKTHNHRFFSL